MRIHAAALDVVFLLLIALAAPSSMAAGNECTRTEHMRIYSNAFLSKETGDVGGYELAIEPHNDTSVDALLYVYEGAPNDDGISISGQALGKRVTLEGEWVEHLIEYPSKKEIVQTHHVKIDGTLGSPWFQGNVTIGGLVTPERVRLKRVDHIWLCKTRRRP